MGLTMAFYVATRICRKAVARPCQGFQDVEGTRGSVYTIAGMSDECELGFQHYAQNFRVSVQRSHLVTDSHLWVEPELVGIRSEQSHAGFLRSNGQLFTACPHYQGLTELVSSCLSLHDAVYVCPKPLNKIV